MSNSVSLFSEIDEAKKVATRLMQRNAAVKRATKRRDNSLYRLLAKLHPLDKRLRGIGGPQSLKALRAKYPNARTDDTCILLLRLTYPKLSTKQRSKYAAVLRYVREKKKPDQSVRDCIRANGAIKGCVEKEKKLRDKRPKGWGAK